MTERIAPDVIDALREFAAEVHADVERFALDRAYQVAGGPMLAVASRLGWPAADIFLGYVMAVRALANANRGGTLTFDAAMEQYERGRERIGRYLDPAPGTG